ncbi:hypothetical protein LCX93_07870 [Sulfurimonas sp. SWIR-19]|uniref:hypothetical protein n=1 Tax=Sulfurimonas sp. SWIR-19 TaxID=2878390 RepID=UPI001CF427DE|nr:hypothetical protein [Sulfurimonas sp. SWIR-19]UCM99451.1 hypothetical protein LCX93_07870 [Sulfurimonas sp. SWIR-19]
MSNEDAALTSKVQSLLSNSTTATYNRLLIQTIEVPIYDDPYYNLITNNYENLNKQDIMIDIFKKVA